MVQRGGQQRLTGRKSRWIDGAIVLLLWAVGCSSDSAVEQPQPARQTRNDSADTLPETRWDVTLMDGRRIGYQKTEWSWQTHEGRRYHHARIESTMNVQRFGESTEQRAVITSLETAEGRPLEFEVIVRGGQSEQVTQGVVSDGTLRLETKSGTALHRDERLLPEECGSFSALDKSLLRDALGPGDRRTVRALMPILNAPAVFELEALDWTETDLLAGTARLLKIRNRIHLGGDQTLMAWLWCDAEGRIHKTDLPALKQVTYRVTKQQATAPTHGPQLDLGTFSLVPISPPLDEPHGTAERRYEIRLQDGNPAELFSACPDQAVTRLDEHRVQLTVRAIRPDSERNLDGVQAPLPAHLESSAMIQSDDATVQHLAAMVAPEQTDPWIVAQAIEQFVHRRLVEKNFSTAFASAAEVARSLEGDCTEHALLVAALCRARGIPARVRVGLVYVTSESAFGFHMWNEVWMGDRWVPLDATLGLGGTGADHLTMNRSSVSGSEALLSFLPVLQTLGRIEIRVIGADPP